MMEPQKYTSLFGGERVRKDDLRVEACGALDELSSHLGLLAAEAPAEICDRLHEVQRRLFAIGALTSGMQRATYVPGPAEEAELQAETRRLEAISGGFRGFVLPGGCPAAARADVCRTVCRRAARNIGLAENRWASSMVKTGHMAAKWDISSSAFFGPSKAAGRSCRRIRSNRRGGISRSMGT